MIFTEEEARKHPCRSDPARGIVIGRRIDGSPIIYAPPCSASECHSWRWWESEIEKIKFTPEEFEIHKKDIGAFVADFCIFIPRFNRRRGYCGLAGKPEWE